MRYEYVSTEKRDSSLQKSEIIKRPNIRLLPYCDQKGNRLLFTKIVTDHADSVTRGGKRIISTREITHVGKSLLSTSTYINTYQGGSRASFWRTEIRKRLKGLSSEI